jgi:3',5'-cyclic AMP phosphodiesterase CpdA
VGDREQTEWLEATLAAADARWLIVTMHHPAYSVGYHGSTQEIQDEWVPLFEEYGVDLVLAGHDHDYQRTSPINDVTYIVSGGGSKTRPTGDADYIELAVSVRHFLDIAITHDRLEVTAISTEGPFDHVTINKPID